MGIAAASKTAVTMIFRMHVLRCVGEQPIGDGCIENGRLLPCASESNVPGDGWFRLENKISAAPAINCHDSGLACGRAPVSPAQAMKGSIMAALTLYHIA